MIRRPPRSTRVRSSAASDVYKRQRLDGVSGLDTDPSTLCKVRSNHLDCVGTCDGFDCARGVSNTIDADGYLWGGSTKGICRWKPGAAPEFNSIPALIRRKGLRCD